MYDDLAPEYDLRTLLKGSVQGKYAERFRQGTGLVLLDPEVAQAFPDHRTVNDALRLVIQLSRFSLPYSANTSENVPSVPGAPPKAWSRPSRPAPRNCPEAPSIARRSRGPRTLWPVAPILRITKRVPSMA